MKFLLALGLAISAPAFATSLEMTEVCGPTTMQVIYCVKAPCPQNFNLRLENEEILFLKPVNEALENTLANMTQWGRREVPVCAKGFFSRQEPNVFHVHQVR
jgi:hypothetical protein